MSVWALSDLHLAFGAPEKTMEVFGERWKNYAEKIEQHWQALIAPSDLVLIPGDISWALRLEQALVDLNWIDRLPGKKVLLKGNHDYWWPSNKKLKEALPPSITFINNNALTWNNIAIGGTRLWDTDEFSFESHISFDPNPRANTAQMPDKEQQEKLHQRELERLKLSLSQLDQNAHYRIAMTHYPPIGATLNPSKASALLETYKIDTCVFGHLHNINKTATLFGKKNGVRYLFASADYLDFIPIKIV